MSDERARIKEYYNSLSDSYDELYGQEQARKHARILNEVGNKRFDLLVEVGCGTGVFLDQIAPKCSLAVGTDISQKMLQRARRRVIDDRTEFVVADCSALPFRSRVCDGVVSVSLLKLETGKDQFHELARILRPGGAIIVTAFCPEKCGHSKEGMPFTLWKEVLLTDRESLLLARKPESRGSPQA